MALALRSGDGPTCHKGLLAAIILLPRLAAAGAQWHAHLVQLFGATVALHVSHGALKDASGLEAGWQKLHHQWVTLPASSGSGSLAPC